MTVAFRTPICVAVLLALGACAAAPVAPPEAVAVKANTLTPEYSSFNAQLLSDAGRMEHRFTTSLSPELEPVTRLESTYTQEVGSDRETLRIGDSVSTIGMWGSSVRFGGMQFGTRTNTRDDVIASSGLATTGLAVLPTVADALFASAGDPAATLEQRSLAVNRSLRGGGTSPWSLVAQDALGRTQSIGAPLIAPTRLVASGCQDFSVGIGKVRRDYALASNEYGPLFANTTVACAAPLGFTLEGHGEYLADQVAAFGFGVARQLGPIGTASVAVASSHADIGEGWLARFGFEHTNSMFSLMYRGRIQSREFREIGTDALADPVMQRDLASVGVNVAEGANLSLAYASQLTWERERTNLIALKQSVAMGRGSLSMSAGHSLADNFGSSVFISYKRPLGGTRPLARRPVLDELDLAPLHRALDD